MSVAVLLLSFGPMLFSRTPKTCEVGVATTVEIVGVTDGDTVTLKLTEGRAKVRLFGIDAPEKQQAFGQKAKAALSNAVLGRTITMRKCGVDRYGRIVGELFDGPVSVNRRMLEMGLAWHYRDYSDRTDFAVAESQARRESMGLWGDPGSVPPWLFRAAKKRARKPHQGQHRRARGSHSKSGRR